ALTLCESINVDLSFLLLAQLYFLLYDMNFPLLKGRPVPLILPSFQPLPFQPLFAIFSSSVFEVVQVGQVV
ncbi:TPA: hypothetical protein ACJJXM_004986, partial [Enterobacter hormaechei subsp. xiangfangensis]